MIVIINLLGYLLRSRRPIGRRWIEALRRGPTALASAVGAVLLLASATCRAGNDGYFVTYNSKIHRGEMELMLMTDITSPSTPRREEGFGTYLSHMVELEYGISGQLATEFMVEWFEDLETADRRFAGFRWETRYRLFPKVVPFNPMVYVEYEDLDPSTRYKMEVSGWIKPPYAERGDEPDRERILETRLVLSQDFGPTNLAFNWINETDVSTGDTAFGYAAGLMWMAHHRETEHAGFACPMHPEVRSPQPGTCSKCGMTLVGTAPATDQDEGSDSHAGKAGVGLEMYGAFGDSKAFRIAPARQEHYLGPILMYHLSKHWMMHTQLAIGLSRASDNLVRTSFGLEF